MSQQEVPRQASTAHAIGALFLVLIAAGVLLLWLGPRPVRRTPEAVSAESVRSASAPPAPLPAVPPPSAAPACSCLPPPPRPPCPAAVAPSARGGAWGYD